jgi:hypothetical protein
LEPRKKEGENGGNFICEELHNFWWLSRIVWVIKSRGRRWAGHETDVREIRNVYKIKICS